MTPSLRYRDDLVAMCTSREQAEEVKARLAVWLAPRGLACNEDKIRMTTAGDQLAGHPADHP